MAQEVNLEPQYLLILLKEEPKHDGDDKISTELGYHDYKNNQISDVLYPDVIIKCEDDIESYNKEQYVPLRTTPSTSKKNRPSGVTYEVTTCKICGKIFRGSYGLKVHLSHRHRKCIKCLQVFESKKDLKAHLISSHLQYLYHCRCGENFLILEHFLQKLRNEKRALQHNINGCILCEARFDTEQELMSHMFKVCELQLMDRETLKKHLYKRSGRTRFKCKKCMEATVRMQEEYILENLLKAHNV